MILPVKGSYLSSFILDCKALHQCVEHVSDCKFLAGLSYHTQSFFLIWHILTFIWSGRRKIHYSYENDSNITGVKMILTSGACGLLFIRLRIYRWIFIRISLCSYKLTISVLTMLLLSVAAYVEINRKYLLFFFMFLIISPNPSKVEITLVRMRAQRVKVKDKTGYRGRARKW